MRRDFLSANLRHFKLVTFGATNTLMKFRRPDVEYAIALQHLGLPAIDQQRVAAEFSGRFVTMLAAHPNFFRDAHPKLSWQNWWREVVHGVLRAAGSTMSDSEMRRMGDYMIARYEAAECWDKMAGGTELIDAIRANGQSLGIVSNFDPRLKTIVENVQLPAFDFVLNSYEVGAAKPSSTIFDVALEMCPDGGAAPEQALHVGGVPTQDYLGAREAGWSSVLITHGMPVGPQVAEEHKFESLEHFLRTLNEVEIQWDRPDERVADADRDKVQQSVA